MLRTVILNEVKNPVFQMKVGFQLEQQDPSLTLRVTSAA